MRSVRKYMIFSARDWLKFFLVMASACGLCLILMMVTTSDFHVPLIFVMAEMIISLITDGYFYGFLAAVLGVFAVNWAFTYPYWKLDFSFAGYPITFITMLTVGLVTCYLTSRLKEQEKIRIESAAIKMRAELLRSVSHDIRTPLTSISGAIGVILSEGAAMDEDRKRRLLSGAAADADWLVRVVENLLSITRIGSEESGARIVKTNEMLEEVIEDAVSKFKAGHPDTAICVRLPDDIIFVPMDAVLVEQLLLNLMDNACIHGKTTTEITIGAERKTGFAEIWVSDNGVGVDPEKLPILFDASLQLLNDGKADSSRFMGIGLSVCRAIAAAHGGTIKAENLPEKGARFSFTLETKSGEI